MEKKMVYVPTSCKARGDRFDLGYTFSLAEARGLCERDWNHMAERDRANTADCVNGWLIPVKDGDAPQEAYERWQEGLPWLPDPDYYEEFSPEK